MAAPHAGVGGGFDGGPSAAFGRPRYSFDGASRSRYSPSPLSAAGRRLSVDHYGQGSRPPPTAWNNHRSMTPAAMSNADYYEERRLGEMAGDIGSPGDALDSVSAIHAPYVAEPPQLPYGYDGDAVRYPYAGGGGRGGGPPTSFSWPAAVTPNDAFQATGSEPGHFYAYAPHPGSAQMYDDPYAGYGWNAAAEYHYQPPHPPHSMASGSSSAPTLAHPASLYPASPHAETPPSIFGVHADHHGGMGSDRRRSARADHLPAFPPWSRTWYDGHMSANGHAYTTVPPPDGASGWESETLTRSGRSSRPHPRHSHGRDSADFVKEERIRMLEKKFGKPKIKHRGQGDEDDEADDDDAREVIDPDADLAAGAVTSKGSIKMPWPKTYLTLKILLVLVALVAFVMALLAVLMIKPDADATPAIKSSPVSWALHVAALLSFLLMTWLFLFRPCCCDSGRSAAKHGGAGLDNGPAGLAGMVIPVMGGGGGGGPDAKRGFFGRKKKGMQPGQMMAPTVNLIVDPSALGNALNGGKRKKKRRRRKGDYDGAYSSDDDEDDDDSDDDDDDDEEAIPGAFRGNQRRKNPLERMKQRRLHALALASLRRALTWLTLFALVLLALVVVVFAFSKGQATTCKSEGSSWCLCWSVEMACTILVEIGIVCVLILGWWGFSKSRRALGRSGPGGGGAF